MRFPQGVEAKAVYLLAEMVPQKAGAASVEDSTFLLNGIPFLDDGVRGKGHICSKKRTQHLAF